MFIEIIDTLTEKQRRPSEFHGKGQMAEKRTDQRKNHVMFIDYSCRNRLYKDFIQNISMGGVFIETKQPFSPRQEIIITIPFSKSLKHLKIKGEIIRVSRHGIAVKFKKNRK